MTWALGPTTGVVEAIDSQGKPFNVGMPGLPGQSQQQLPPVLDAVPACLRACEQGGEPCPHPDDCYVPVDRDLQRVIGWSLVGFWGVLLWWVL